MANNVQITPGSGDVVGAEDIGSVKFQKVKLIDSTAGSTAGTGTLANPLVVTGSTTIISMPAITGSTTIVAMPAVTGSVSVVSVGSIVSITGSTTVVTMPAITGSVTIIAATLGTVTITGSTVVNSIGSIVTITGSTAVLDGGGSITVDNAGTFPVQIPTTGAGVIGTVIVSNASLTVTGSVSIIGTMGTVTVSNGTVSVTNTVSTLVTSIGSVVTVTGSVNLVGLTISSVTISGTMSTTIVGQTLPTQGSATISATTAGTTILVPSTAANSIYLTDLIVSNGATAGWVYLGNNPGATAPTTTAILIQNLYFAANGGISHPFRSTIKVPASNNLVLTAVSCTTISATATYYVAP